MESIGTYRTFNKMYGQWQFVAPYKYAFFDSNRKLMGRIIWTNNVQGIYLDRCNEAWGL